MVTKSQPLLEINEDFLAQRSHSSYSSSGYEKDFEYSVGEQNLEGKMRFWEPRAEKEIHNGGEQGLHRERCDGNMSDIRDAVGLKWRKGSWKVGGNNRSAVNRKAARKAADLQLAKWTLRKVTCVHTLWPLLRLVRWHSVTLEGWASLSLHRLENKSFCFLVWLLNLFSIWTTNC